MAKLRCHDTALPAILCHARAQQQHGRSKAVRSGEDAMRNRKWSRRDLLKASTASAAGVLFAEPLKAAAPPPTAVTPALIEAARKEGKVSFYTRARAQHRRTAGARRSRRNIPGLPCASSAPARSGFSSASRRSRASGINAVDVANSHRSRALSRLEEERLARALSPRGRRQAFSGRSGRSRRHVRDRRAPGWR